MKSHRLKESLQDGRLGDTSLLPPTKNNKETAIHKQIQLWKNSIVQSAYSNTVRKKKKKTKRITTQKGLLGDLLSRDIWRRLRTRGEGYLYQSCGECHHSPQWQRLLGSSPEQVPGDPNNPQDSHRLPAGFTVKDPIVFMDANCSSLLCRGH